MAALPPIPDAPGIPGAPPIPGAPAAPPIPGAPGVQGQVPGSAKREETPEEKAERLYRESRAKKLLRVQEETIKFPLNAQGQAAIDGEFRHFEQLQQNEVVKAVNQFEIDARSQAQNQKDDDEVAQIMQSLMEKATRDGLIKQITSLRDRQQEDFEKPILGIDEKIIKSDIQNRLKAELLDTGVLSQTVRDENGIMEAQLNNQKEFDEFVETRTANIFSEKVNKEAMFQIHQLKVQKMEALGICRLNCIDSIIIEGSGDSVAQSIKTERKLVYNLKHALSIREENVATLKFYEKALRDNIWLNLMQQETASKTQLEETVSSLEELSSQPSNQENDELKVFLNGEKLKIEQNLVALAQNIALGKQKLDLMPEIIQKAEEELQFSKGQSSRCDQLILFLKDPAPLEEILKLDYLTDRRNNNRSPVDQKQAQTFGKYKKFTEMLDVYREDINGKPTKLILMKLKRYFFNSVQHSDAELQKEMETRFNLGQRQGQSNKSVEQLIQELEAYLGFKLQDHLNARNARIKAKQRAEYAAQKAKINANAPVTGSTPIPVDGAGAAGAATVQNPTEESLGDTVAKIQRALDAERERANAAERREEAARRQAAEAQEQLARARVVAQQEVAAAAARPAAAPVRRGRG